MDQFTSTSKAEPGHDVFKTAGSERSLSVVLLFVGAIIIVTLLQPALAAEIAGESMPGADKARFYELVAPCVECHAIDQQITEPVGPTLKGVFGRRVAGIRSYDYSAAFYQMAAVGMIWDEVSLDQFLESPQSMAPGNAMTFSGVPDAADRTRLINWLASGPAPLDADALAASAQDPDPEVKAILQLEADPQYGEYLAGKCLTCHYAPGASSSIPPISGLPADYFVQALLEYQQGKRSNPIMMSMSDSLGAEELAALADYFTQPSLDNP